MNKGVFFLLGLMLVGCDSTHKLTGTDYVDLETEQAPQVVSDYPSVIADTAGWNDLTTELKPKGTEEIRFWFSSSLYPSHLIKLTKSKKGDVNGEVILYWPNKSNQVQPDYTHQTMMYYLDGTCDKFYSVGSYGYCYPKLDEDIRWASIYSAIEGEGFWQLPAGVNPAETEKDWQMYVQVRLRNYYRDYQHLSPHAYEDKTLSRQVMSLARAVKIITGRFEASNGTNSFEGITDGNSFTLCDSSETWDFVGDLNGLLNKAGLKTSVNTEKEKSRFYTLIKGRVSSVWYNEWATGEFDRKLYPNEIYNIRVVNQFECPSDFTSK